VEAEKERDKHYGRLAGLLWNGAIDNYKAGDLQQWSKDYTAEISALRLALEEALNAWKGFGEVARMNSDWPGWARISKLRALASGESIQRGKG